MNPSDRAGLRSCIRPSFPSGIGAERGEREELGRREGLPQRPRIFGTDRIVSRWNTAACPATKNGAYLDTMSSAVLWWSSRVIYGCRRRENLEIVANETRSGDLADKSPDGSGELRSALVRVNWYFDDYVLSHHPRSRIYVASYFPLSVIEAGISDSVRPTRNFGFALLAFRAITLGNRSIPRVIGSFRRNSIN